MNKQALREYSLNNYMTIGNKNLVMLPLDVYLMTREKLSLDDMLSAMGLPHNAQVKENPSQVIFACDRV